MSWISLTYARPGEGKTLTTCDKALELLNDYIKTEKKYPELPKRALWSNIKFSKEVEEAYLGKIFYWSSPKQLVDLRHVDIIWDEIGRHLPSDNWKDVPDELRALFSMHRKRGLRIFATTQDYKAVDINFRRMVGQAYKVKKIFGSRDISATLPPVKFIYGLILKYAFNPDEVEQDKSGGVAKSIIEAGFPDFIFITEELVNAYDTTQEIPPYQPDCLHHQEKHCPVCGKTEVKHRTL